MIIVKDRGNKINITHRQATYKINTGGRRGIPGPQGDPGEGVPEGGAAGQVLTKQSGVDYDTAWENPAAGGVTSVNGKTGVVVLDKTDIGLSNVDNTSDLNKPISSSTQAALDDKANGTELSNYVLKSGDTMIGNLRLADGVNLLLGTTGSNRFLRYDTGESRTWMGVGADNEILKITYGGASGRLEIDQFGFGMVAQFTSGVLSMLNHQIKNVADPTDDDDSANKGYVDTRTGENFRIVSASSTTIAEGIAALITNKAEDNTVVHLASTETITGHKTFSGIATFSSGMRSVPINRTTGQTLGASTPEVNLCNATTAPITITLPLAAVGSGQRYTIKKTDSSVNQVTVQTTSGQTIDGSTTYILSAQYDFVTVISDGLSWHIIADN